MLCKFCRRCVHVLKKFWIIHFVFYKLREITSLEFFVCTKILCMEERLPWLRGEIFNCHVRDLHSIAQTAERTFYFMYCM